MTTFLKQFLFDDVRLRERTLTELVYAFSTGRMIAFVGSMATESLGYGQWKTLVDNYVRAAVALADCPGGNCAAVRGREAARARAASVQLYWPCDKIIDRRVALSLAKEILDHLDASDPLGSALSAVSLRPSDEAPAIRPNAGNRRLAADGWPTSGSLAGSRPLGKPARADLLDAAVAEFFGQRQGGKSGLHRGQSVVQLLARELRIRRFATLNYDLEIEAELMIDAADASRSDDPLGHLQDLLRRGDIRSDPEVPTRLSRLLPDGVFVESDVRDRARPERLIDFAVGSADDRRIMHLHGRATDPDTMIVGLRDYDRLYRKNDLSRLPFEHGQRILFAGNPVLFVGAGMNEQEVTGTLQEFVSNNPYKRFAPAFLLWGTSSFSVDGKIREEQMWLKRIDFFRRFGLLTVFYDDLKPTRAAESIGGALGHEHAEAWKEFEQSLSEAAALGSDEERRELDLKLLAQSIPLMARACAVHNAALQDYGSEKGRWRSLSGRLEGPSRAVGHNGRKPPFVTLWYTPKLSFASPCDLNILFGSAAARGVRMRVVVAPAGSGKGALAWRVASARGLPDGFDAPLKHRLVINAGFALDSDFLLLAISRFLLKMKGDPRWTEGREQSRERQFEADDAFVLPGPWRRKALIIINGIERFFTIDGAPLSAELDHLFRRIARDRTGDVRWLFGGTPRIERYFRTICDPAVVPFARLCPRNRTADLASAAEGEINSVYFAHLITTMKRIAQEKHGLEEAAVADKIDGAVGHAVADYGDEIVVTSHSRGQPREISRAVVDAYVNVPALRRARVTDAPLAMEVLRALAFIGNPVEGAVLLHVPRVRDLICRTGGNPIQRLLAILTDLTDMCLVIEVEPFHDYPAQDGNAGSHAARPDESRSLWVRYGLHTAVSAELRRRFGVPLTEAKLSTSFNMSLYAAQPADSIVPDPAIHDELGTLIDHLIGAHKDRETGEAVDPPDPVVESERRAGPHATAAMRAALAVIRSYYSTASLLTLETDNRSTREDRDGVLLEHAERLETLLRAFRKLRRVRSKRPQEGTAQPFYAEDLVWIFNELGVVYLVQGDLYSARRNFHYAMGVNKRFVEFDCRSHNWRRISMNQVFLEIERADLSAADEKLREIEATIDAKPGDPRHPDCSRFEAIQRILGRGGSTERTCFDRHVMHEEVLMTGLVLGHRAMSHHIRGHLRTAERLYEEAIAILRRLGEHRAYAMFQRLYAQLLGITDPRASCAAARLAASSSEAVRQMDMAYHARIAEAHQSWKAEPSDAEARRKAINHLTRALSHAAVMDLYRLRVEAGIYLARLMLDSGDYESALEHATDAMSLAARYGLSLRKISLRIDIGHILIRRGDPRPGRALIATAVETADRFGYERAVESAQRILVEEGLFA